ncbi:MAG: flippase-like domain-containing protein [Motilibacteraceae bacterium]
MVAEGVRAHDAAPPGRSTSRDAAATDRPGARQEAPGRPPQQPTPEPPPERLTERVVDGCRVVDLPPPARSRRPADLVRTIACLVGLAVVLLLAALTPGASQGLQRDVGNVRGLLPSALVAIGSIVVLAGSVGGPVVVALDLVLLRRKPRLLADAVLAAVAAVGLALLVQGLLSLTDDASALDRLLTSLPGGQRATLPAYPFIAFLTAAGLEGRERLRVWVWALAGLAVAAGVLAGDVTTLAAVAGILLSRAAGTGVRYAAGRPARQPWGREVSDALGRAGLPLAELVRYTEADVSSRAYRARSRDGRRLDVTVLDRDRQDAGLLYRLYRRARLREQVDRRAIVSLRRAVETEALASYAASAAGAPTPRLLAVADAGGDGAVLAYEHVPGLPLDQLAAAQPEAVDGHLLDRCWEALGTLHRARIAHRQLTGRALLVDVAAGTATADGPTGAAATPAAGGQAAADPARVQLVDLRAAEVAAGDLPLRLDRAHLLVTTALAAGPEPAIAAALRALTPEEAVGVVPLLQPIALPRRLRTALAGRRAVLTELREGLVQAAPEVEPEQVRLVRLSWRSLLTGIAGGVAAYVLLSQLGSVDLRGLVTRADPGWIAVGLGLSVVTYVGAAVGLAAYAPERLPLALTSWVQLASSFASFVTPPTVGQTAVNVRYLQRRQVPAAVAVASVALRELTAFVSTVLLLVLCAAATGSTEGARLLPSRRTLLVVAALAVIVAAALAVPPLRRWAWRRVRPTAAQVLPRLLDVLQQPVRLVLGLVGTLVLTLGYVFCLVACLHAFGASAPVTAVAVAYLAGSAVGSAAPTPGGLGAVEAAVAAGLTAVGVDGGLAVSAVLLFRLLTFWLPVLPGWLAFRRLTERGVL